MTDVWPSSVQVLGGRLSFGLPTGDAGVALFSVCGPPGTGSTWASKNLETTRAVHSTRGLASWRRLWQQRECIHVAGADDSKVPMVQRRDLGDIEAFGQGDHRCVGGPEW